MPETAAAPSSVAWRWREAAADEAAARAREAAAARRQGLLGGAIGLAVAGALLYFGREKTGGFVAGVAVAIALLALVAPLTHYRHLISLFDRFAHLVGTAITWVLMTLLFFLVFLPFGLLLRARGRLRVSRRPDPGRVSYWAEASGRVGAADAYRKQF
ncbi:MAG TPA: hypothetical protein VGE98_03750 [Thermoanaerobaculia bacterium]